MSFSLATSRIVWPGSPVTSLPFILSLYLFSLLPPPLFLFYSAELAYIDTFAALDALVMIDGMLFFHRT